MELERKEKEMIDSIFVQTTYKGIWGLEYDCDRSYRYQTFELITDYEVLNKEIILKTQIPFTLKTNEKIYLNDIGETVTIKDIVKSLDGSYVYEVEPKYINDSKITKEEAMKKFSIEELNNISEKYKKLHEDYVTLQRKFDKEKSSGFNCKTEGWFDEPTNYKIERMGRTIKEMSLHKRIFKWEKNINEIICNAIDEMNDYK